jgi:hypothetical protein
MVALLRLLKQRQVRLEVLLVAPRRAVDALEHRVLLVAAPVRAGHAHQFEGVGGNLTRVLQVWAAAKILEAVLLVGADHRLLGRLVAVLVDAAFFQPLDQFELVHLAGKELARFIGADLAVDKRMLARDDLAHPLLDLLQFLWGEGARLALRILAQVEVVIEAVIDGRPDGDLGFRVDLQHRLRHHVRGAVADFVKLLVIELLIQHHESHQ